MASLIFRTVDFMSSGRHPSEFDFDQDLEPFSAGVSPTSSPFVMSTRNSFAGTLPGLPSPPAPLTVGELAAKFSEQSIEPSFSVISEEHRRSNFSQPQTSNPPTPPRHLSTSEFDPQTLTNHRSLSASPCEDDCIPNDIASHLLTPPSSRRPTNAHLYAASPRHSTSAPSSDPIIDFTPTSHPSSPRSRHRPSSSHSYETRYPPELSLDDKTPCDSRRDSGYSPDSIYEPETLPSLADFSSAANSHKPSIACCEALRDIYRRRSTSAVMDIVGAKAVGTRRLRARRLAEEQQSGLRRVEDCGVSKSSRYRRSARRGAVSF